MEGDLCNFLVFVFLLPHLLEIFLLTSLAIATIIVNHNDIDCVDHVFKFYVFKYMINLNKLHVN